jgi:recombination associated protein RdgC
MTELLFKQLQTTLERFPITPLQAQVSPASVMSSWLLQNTLPASLETGSECEIQDDSEDKATIRFKALEPLSEDITRHLADNMRVKNLAVRWTDKVSFVMFEDLSLRKLKVDDALKEQAFSDSQGGGLADLDADFALMSLTLRDLFASYCLWFEINTDSKTQLDDPLSSPF